MKKVVLAYSGGLDTSIILHWLLKKGYEVVCFVANVGQKEDFSLLEKKARDIGASQVYVEDLRKEFVEQYIFRALKAQAVYEGRYLLGTSLSRPLIAKKQVEIAAKENTSFVAHGATGKGNDQVRFELAYHTLMKEPQIISPWKETEFLKQFSGRSDMLSYAEQNGIPVTSTRTKPYSIDENLMHTSYEGGMLEDPFQEPSEDMFQKTKSPQKAPDEEVVIALTFREGVPVALQVINTDESIHDSPLKLFMYLNEIAGLHGVGRVDLVENRFIGMKSRGVYETPAGTVLWKAHKELEALVLDREVFHLKEVMSSTIGQLIYNGFWFSPEMEFLMSAVEKSQEKMTGDVFVKLYKGNVSILKRQSPHSLYQQEIASMDRLGGYNQCDAKGFITLQALRLKHFQGGRV